MNRNRVSVLFALGLVWALVLTACGSGAPSAPAPVEEANGAGAAQEAQEGAAPQQKIAVYAFSRNLADLDPSTASTDEYNVFINTYETLTTYDPKAEDPIQPLLATSWESNEDGTEWTFKLRQGVTFHDGTPFNAEAVKYSIERTIQKEVLGYQFPVDSIDVIDDYTVKFNLQFSAPFAMLLATPWGAYMVSPSTADKDADWFNQGNEAGTGPYMIESYEPNQRLVITQYKDYWGGWTGDEFTKVVFELVEDATVREQMIRSGEADYTWDLAYDNYAALGPDIQVLVEPGFQVSLVGLNTAKPPVDNIQVRKALAYSYPADTIVQNIYGGYAKKATGIVPSSMWVEQPDLKGYEFDLDKAKSLFQDAGVAEGTSIDYTYLIQNPELKTVGELWKAELAKIGINLEIQGQPIETVIGRLGDPATAWDALGTDWNTGVPNMYDMLAPYFHSQNAIFPISYYNNPEYDALLDEALALSGVDMKGANKLYAQAQQILLGDAVMIPVAEVAHVAAARADLKNIRLNPAHPYAIRWYEVRR